MNEIGRKGHRKAGCPLPRFASSWLVCPIDELRFPVSGTKYQGAYTVLRGAAEGLPWGQERGYGAEKRIETAVEMVILPEATES